MRRVIYAGVFVLIFLLLAIIKAPLSFVVDRVEARQPALQHLVTSGSVWHGQVLGLRLGQQKIGNLSLDSAWTALLSGKWTSRFQLIDGAIAGRGTVSAGLDGRIRLKDVRVSGATVELIGLRPEVRSLDGHFTIDILDAVLKDSACVSASGTAWTDILTKLEGRWRWKGPELSGPVSCENGKILVRLTGQGEQNERVSAFISTALDSTGHFEASIENPPGDVAQAASLLGFVYDGNNAVTYRFDLNAAESGSRNE